MSRHSIKNSLRAVRSARTSSGLAELRYLRRPEVAELIAEAVRLLNAAERALLEARTTATGRKLRRVAA